MTRQAFDIPREQLADELLRQELLAGNAAAASRVAAMAETFRLPLGATLFEAGQEAALYFILAGRMNLSVDGKVRAEFGAGHALGEYPLVFLERHHQASASAKEEAIVATVPLEDFRQLTRELPELWQPIARSLAKRLETRNRVEFDDPARALKAYAVRSSAVALRHRAAAERCARNNLWIGVPATALSIIVGSSVFVSVASGEPSTILLIATGLLSLAAAILSGLQTFLGFSEQAQAHKAAADGHEAASREVDSILIKADSLMARGRRDDAEAVLVDGTERIVTALATLAKSSPNLGPTPQA